MATSQPNAQTGPAPRRGWFGRNWKWFAPVSILLTLVASGVIYGVTMFWPEIKLRNSVPYHNALAEVCGNAKIQEALGAPIEAARFLPGGELTTEQANLQFGVRGTKGTGTVNGKARIFDNEWCLQRLIVKVGDGPEIDITPPLPQKNDVSTDPLKNAPFTKEAFPDVNVDVPPPTEKPSC